VGVPASTSAAGIGDGLPPQVQLARLHAEYAGTPTGSLPDTRLRLGLWLALMGVVSRFVWRQRRCVRWQRPPDDREAYTEGKAPFIAAALALAPVVANRKRN
jgi:hypothetical protein